MRKISLNAAVAVLVVVHVAVVKVTTSERAPAFKTTIRKCCPHDQVLSSRYGCVKVPDRFSATEKTGFVRNFFWEKFCGDNKCSDLRLKTVSFGGCPQPQRIELDYLEAFPNGSLVAGFQRTSQLFLIRQPNGCGDLALPEDPEDPLEGPIYVSCQNKNELGSVAPIRDDRLVTKCCPKGQVLDSGSKLCLDISEVKSETPIPSWPMPGRRIRDHETLLPTPLYRTDIFPSVNNWCQDPSEAPVFEEPTVVLTNGSVTFGTTVIDGVVCVDAGVDPDRDLNSHVAVLCRQRDEVVSRLDDDPRNDCPQDGSTVCLPKCCPENSIFDVDELRCKPANDSDLYRSIAYKFELNSTSSKNNSYNLYLDDSVTVASTDYYVHYLHVTFCPSNYGFLPPTTHVILLTDGRLFIDNGAVAEIYNDGFCIDHFVGADEKPFVSAFVCNNVVHSIRSDKFRRISLFSPFPWVDFYFSPVIKSYDSRDLFVEF